MTARAAALLATLAALARAPASAAVSSSAASPSASTHSATASPQAPPGADSSARNGDEPRELAPGSKARLAELLGVRALENDAFVPVSAAAAARFAEGDALFGAVRAKAGGATGPAAALDAWRAALVESATGDGVPAREARASGGWLTDPGGALAARVVVGVELALEERLTLAGAATRAAWRARFEPMAAVALADARAADDVESALAALERVFPSTSAAASAALALADTAYERGDDAAARAWLERAREHAVEPFASALAVRARAFSGASSAADASGAAGALRAARATHFVAETTVALGDEDGFRAAEETRVQFGAVALDGDGLAVQSARRVLVRREDGDWARADLEELLTSDVGLPPPAFADRAADWVLRPAAAGGTLACVVGRSTDEADDVLLGLDARTLSRRFAHVGVAELVRAPACSAAGLRPGRGEFAPGLAAAAGLVLAQVRIWPTPSPAATPGATDPAPAPPRPPRLAPGRIEAWLVALDPRAGAPRWARLLARGASRVAAQEKENLGITIFAPPPAPPGVEGGLVAALTGLSTWSVVEALDGRLRWTLRVPRAKAGEQVPIAVPAPRFLADGGLAAAGDDGPFLLRASARGLDAAHGLALLLRPEPEFLEARAVLGVDAAGVVALADGGRGWVERRAGALVGASFDPGPRERVLAAGVVLEERVVAVTERALYLLDRGRGLAVLDRAPLAPGDAGAVHLEGDRVWVLGPARIRSFRLE